MPRLVIMKDFDGDGMLDIMVTSSSPLDQMHLFHNNGVHAGKFTSRMSRPGPA